ILTTLSAFMRTKHKNSIGETECFTFMASSGTITNSPMKPGKRVALGGGDLVSALSRLESQVTYITAAKQQKTAIETQCCSARTARLPTYIVPSRAIGKRRC